MAPVIEDQGYVRSRVSGPRRVDVRVQGDSRGRHGPALRERLHGAAGERERIDGLADVGLPVGHELAHRDAQGVGSLCCLERPQANQGQLFVEDFRDDVLLDVPVVRRLTPLRTPVDAPGKRTGQEAGKARPCVDAVCAGLRDIEAVARDESTPLRKARGGQFQHTPPGHLGIIPPPEMPRLAGCPVVFEGLLALDVLEILGGILVGDGERHQLIAHKEQKRWGKEFQSGIFHQDGSVDRETRPPGKSVVVLNRFFLMVPGGSDHCYCLAARLISAMKTSSTAEAPTHARDVKT